MAKGFDDVQKAFADLRRRHEDNPSSANLKIKVERSAFSSAKAYERFQNALREAADVGALELTFGKKSSAGEVQAARLVDPVAFYRLTGHTPSYDAAKSAVATIAADLSDWEGAVISEIEQAWAANNLWYGIQKHEVGKIRQVMAISKAIIADEHVASDYRTFSSRFAGDSKFLELYESAVVRYLSFGKQLPSGKPRAVLSDIGLDRISQPTLMSGPFSLSGYPVGNLAVYLGIPFENSSELDFFRLPKMVLTIENLASFTRYCNELNTGRNDLVIYTGGQPSFRFKKMMTHLKSKLSDAVPIYHWGDIDGGGVEIFKTMEQIFPTVRPHLMTAEIARTHGLKAFGPLKVPTASSESKIRTLLNFLAGEAPYTLEQENLDPVRPIF